MLIRHIEKHIQDYETHDSVQNFQETSTGSAGLFRSTQLHLAALCRR